ncbi:MAG: hypothetical protein AAFR54_02250 [Planctomycetota bacterium]
MTVRRLAALALVLSALLPAAAAQFRETLGGPLGRFSTDDVAAPLVAPVERWRVPLGTLLCDPVVHDGKIAVVVQKGRAAQLRLLDLEDGSELAKFRIKRKAGRVGVSLHEVYVTVATDQEVVSGEFRGGKFKRRLRAAGDFQGSVATGLGWGAVPAKDSTHVYDLRKGRLITEVTRALARPIFFEREGTGFGYFYVLRPIDPSEGTTRPITVRPIPDEYLYVVTARENGLRRRATFEPEWPMHFLRESKRGYEHVTLEDTTSKNLDEPARLHFGGNTGSARYRLDVRCTGPGVVWGDRLLGRLSDRSIWVVTEPGTDASEQGQEYADIFGIVDGESVPANAVDTPMSAASGVLLLGNWAVEIESSRVLWVAEHLDIVGRPIPAADGVIVFEAEDGTLVCAAEPEGAVVAAAPAPTSDGALGDGSAVVLRDGTRVAGEVTVERGSIRVAPEGAEPRVFAAHEVAAEEAADGLVEASLPFALYRAATAELERTLCADVVELAELCADLSLVADSRFFVEEAERLGADATELEKVQRVLSTKTELDSSTRSVKVQRARKSILAVRAAAEERRAERVRWLEEQGLTIQAGAVLCDYWRDQGVVERPRRMPESIREEVKRIRDFETLRYEYWLGYARALAPANARLATDEEAARVDQQSAAWEDASLYQSPRIELLTHEKNIDVVGGVLRFGEGTIEALERLLGADPDALDERFDVRLHADRDAYLEEEVLGMTVAPRFSSGVYIPDVRTSRFYVPDVPSGRLERMLYKVVAHELTHQFVQERWARRPGDSKPRKPTEPGYWIVEGLAGYVEDQSVEMARFGLDLDNATVSSIEVASEMLRLEKLIPMETFLSMSQVELFRLEDDEDTFEVSLRREAMAYEVDPISAYYAQAAALTFFLVQRAGDEVRGRFYDALEAHYSGGSPRDGAPALGFETAEELDEAFRAFLERPLGD